MQQEKIKLSNNHRRVLSIILKIIEKDMDMMIGILDNPPCGITYKVTKEFEQDDIESKNLAIMKIKKLVEDFYKKYDLITETLSQGQIFNAKKTGLWTILIDAYSDKLGRYGKFEYEHAKNFDAEITELVNLIEKI
jgi:hypothetical protein